MAGRQCTVITLPCLEREAPRVLEDQKEVEVWGIAKREAGTVYKMVSKRLEQEQ
ncbi:hypothetical protein KAU37_01565 [Candidatus Bipolaricaulota bacterium]|nr:hypothetical protein [Candidatus Bipolaricaulota bacterium]